VFTITQPNQPVRASVRIGQRITVDIAINNAPTVIRVHPPTTQNRIQDIQLTGSLFSLSIRGCPIRSAKILTHVLRSGSFSFCTDYT